MQSTLFHEVYELCTAQFGGAFIPEAAAELIAQRSGLDADTVAAALKSPKVFLYPDVLPALDQILNRPAVLPLIWTEGQLRNEKGEAGYQMHKITASNLLKRYAAWTETAALGLSPVIGGMTKVDALPTLAATLATGKVGQVLVVDDNPVQLAAAGAWLSKHQTPFQLLHIDRSPIDRSQIDQTEDEHRDPLVSIRRIHSLLELIPLLNAPGPHLILFDLDYTLIDHAQTREEMGERIERLRD